MVAENDLPQVVLDMLKDIGLVGAQRVRARLLLAGRPQCHSGTQSAAHRRRRPGTQRRGFHTLPKSLHTGDSCGAILLGPPPAAYKKVVGALIPQKPPVKASDALAAADSPARTLWASMLAALATAAYRVFSCRLSVRHYL